MTISMTAPAGTQRLMSHRGAEPLPWIGLADLIELLDGAGLTGRGGAGFPTGRKLRSLAGTGNPVVVGNGMEGEEFSRKDAFLLTRAPHLVIDGMQVVATALGAQRTILAIGPRIDPAAARSAAGNRGVDVRVLSGGFLAGQESALVNQLNGRPAIPSDPLTSVRERGVDGRPTLVSNVETFAQIALLARYGADWFRSVGTAEDPGTFLVTVTGAVDHPGVLEVARGATLRSVLDSSGAHPASGFLIGGFHGTWLPGSAAGVELSREGLAAYDGTVGAGIVHVVGIEQCPLRIAAGFAAKLAEETSGQCGPCINGLPRIADSFARLAAHQPASRGAPPHISRLPEEIARLAMLASGRGACAHPDGTVRMLLSCLRAFPGHVGLHLSGGCDATAH